MRITCTIPTLTSGGAERVLTTMANFWVGHGHEVTVITLAAQDQPPFYVLDERVTRVGLDLMRPAKSPAHAIGNNIRRLQVLRRAIRSSRSDVVIGFLHEMNVQTLIALQCTGIPVIITEHTDPNLAARNGAWDRLRTTLYPRASGIVVLSESSKQFFSPRLQDRIRIIPNPIVIEPGEPVLVDRSRKRIAALGRFGPEKGFDTLLAAFAQLAPRFPDWDLVIWGDGVLRPDLEAQREQLGMQDRIALPGKTTEPHRELRTADLYVLSSRREGFPMALAEAMACGLPVVAFNLPSGPRDIVRDGVDGLLVPNQDAAALRDAMARLMGDDGLRRQMAAEAPAVLDRFGVEPVMAIWDDLITEAAGTR